MTRVKEKENLIIIHEDIKLLIENENIRGCKFTPVDQVNCSLRKSLRDLARRGPSDPAEN